MTDPRRRAGLQVNLRDFGVFTGETDLVALFRDDALGVVQLGREPIARRVGLATLGTQ